MTTSVHKFFLVGLLLGAAQVAPPLRAEEGGSGHYFPGSISSFMDGVPLSPTFIVRYNLAYYNGDVSMSQPLPIAGLDTLGAQAVSWVNALSLAWRPPIELGEHWSYALSATVPLVSMEVTANVVSGSTSVRRSSSLTDLGDVVFMPLMLNYNINSNLNMNFRLGAYAPTGDYEVGRLANTGKNFWTVEPTLGLMYFGVKNGFEASVFFGGDFNTENEATSYQTGTQVHLDGTLAQHLPLLGGLAGVGASGFYYKQVEGDSGAGAMFGDFKGQTTGVGPVLSYAFKVGRVDMLAEAKWLHEVETHNRLQGDIVWLKVIAKF